MNKLPVISVCIICGNLVYANTDAMRLTWSGDVEAVATREFDAAAGDPVSGVICIDTAEAPLDDSFSNSLEGVFRSTVSPWMTFAITVDGRTYTSFNEDQNILEANFLYGTPDGTTLLVGDLYQTRFWSFTEERTGQTTTQHEFQLFFESSPAPSEPPSLERAFSLSRGEQPIEGDEVEFTRNVSTQPGRQVELIARINEISYSPASSFVPATGLVDLPSVIVDGEVYSAQLVLLPETNPMTFEVVSLSSTTRRVTPNTASFAGDTQRLHIPSVKIGTGSFARATLRLLPGSPLRLELVSASIAPCL